MSRKKRIYISGGITGVENYEKVFECAEKAIRDCGAEPVNPVKICESLPKDFSHLEYMKICLAALDSCDGIFMLPRYSKSIGAMCEFGYALANGTKVYFG